MASVWATTSIFGKNVFFRVFYSSSLKSAKVNSRERLDLESSAALDIQYLSLIASLFSFKCFDWFFVLEIHQSSSVTIRRKKTNVENVETDIIKSAFDIF